MQTTQNEDKPTTGRWGKAGGRFFAFLPLDYPILYKYPLNLALSECRFHLPLPSQASLNTVSSAIQAGVKRGNQTQNKNMRIGQTRIPRSITKARLVSTQATKVRGQPCIPLGGEREEGWFSNSTAWEFPKWARGFTLLLLSIGCVAYYLSQLGSASHLGKVQVDPLQSEVKVKPSALCSVCSCHAGGSAPELPCSPHC